MTPALIPGTSSLRVRTREGAGLPARSDTELLTLAAAGDRAAFGELVERHQEMVLRIVSQRVKSLDGARDLVQRVFLAALESLDRRGAVPPTGPESVRGWLATIALHQVANHERSLLRWLRGALTRIDREREVPPEAEAGLVEAESERRLRASFAHLTPRQQEVVALRIDAGLSFAAVGAALGISEQNARVQFHLALTRIKAMADRNFEGLED